MVPGKSSNGNKMVANKDIDNNNNNVWNVLTNDFSDFLSCVFPYIADRTVWNSIASSNKDMNKKSKSILPPWPKMYRLLGSNKSYLLAAWSLDGTRVAYAYDYGRDIAIVDQRHGVIYRIDNNDEYVFDIKFSPDGRFLVSADQNGIVRLWDNLTGNYEQLKEWNVKAETEGNNVSHFSFSISTCSRYIVVSLNNHVFLKEIENGDTIKSLMTRLDYNMKDKVKFSVDGNGVFRCFSGNNRVFVGIKVWRPYLDDAEENVITLWQQPATIISKEYVGQYAFSNDTTMIAMIYKRNGIKGVELRSIDNDYKGLKLVADFQMDVDTLQFTQDDKYIVCGLNNVLWFWSIEENEIAEVRHVSYNGHNNTNLIVKYYSPNSQRLIVFNPYNGKMLLCYHIAS